MTDTDFAGVASMARPLRRVGLRRPGAILHADHELWHYGSPINAKALDAQYDNFVSLVAASGAEISWFDDADDDLADSIFTYDPSFVVPGGAVLLRPGKELRLGEIDVHRAFYEANNIPVLGQIDAPGTIEGGDCLFLDERTLIVGEGFRTNREGIEQLRSILSPLGVTVESFDLPYFKGPEACLHLMSMVSPLDDDLALIHAPLMPTALYQRMLDSGYTLLHGPEDEFAESFGLNLNVLATAPREVIAVEGFPETVALMRSAGCTVQTFDASALCLPCEGGPTCLTRPLSRG